MIDFINRVLEKVPKDKKVNVIWHSLGWALTQIATTIYRERVWESYTFNSPWAKNLKATLEKDDPYFKSLQEFMTNKDSSNVSSLLTNVKWEKWISLIADLWVDIWDYEIKLKWLSSHSIVATWEYIHNLPENSKELESIFINSNNENSKKEEEKLNDKDKDEE
jgi:pimeloyl-ACP methyl ester carboxylesterase